MLLLHTLITIEYKIFVSLHIIDLHSLFFIPGKVGLFYLIFYGVLAALVAICMWIFFQTLDPRIPKWQLDRSIIGTNPGMGFRPMPEDNLESTLIWFQGSNRSNYEKWENNTKAYLDSTSKPLSQSTVCFNLVYLLQSITLLEKSQRAHRQRRSAVLRIHRYGDKCVMLIRVHGGTVTTTNISTITATHPVYSWNWIEYTGGCLSSTTTRKIFRRICLGSWLSTSNLFLQ